MSHKTEAEKLLSMAYNEMSDSGGFFEVQAAFAEATLALVEAQEAANEQARWGNIIAWMTANGHEPGPEIAARIIKAIGIEDTP